ncbi:nucleotidyltransferase [Advenella sp. RU8]|uniref:nucleotidyltransferase domain-containing protein n=1 Tax=Advenella sp. RU8 TaxID=3399575 RepID=UPI003AAE5365
MIQNPSKLSERIIQSLTAHNSTQSWEELIGRLLGRLELPKDVRADAEAAYERLGHQIATKLQLEYTDVQVYSQGSMRTLTTIRPRSNEKFDLDIVVELPDYLYKQNPDPEVMFKDFGQALKGNESVTGSPEEKRRCWRLRYPGKSFYFDVTPAIPDPFRVTGASLRVRDPDTRWSPTNPKDYAEWFCEHANKRFTFQRLAIDEIYKAEAHIEPLPNETIGLDDILRRAIQLMKLHRTNIYWNADERHKEVQPISIIIVTLATRAFEHLYNTRHNSFTSAIEVVLAVVEDMPNYIVKRDEKYIIANPTLPTENFADRWNSDEGLRSREFKQWHKRLEEDLEALLLGEVKSADEDRIRSVFGNDGVEAWKERIKAEKEEVPRGILRGLLAVDSTLNLNTVVPSGSKGTLG